MTAKSLACGLLVLVALAAGASLPAQAEPDTTPGIVAAAAGRSTGSTVTVDASEDAFVWRDYGDEAETTEDVPWWRALGRFLARFVFVLGLLAATLFGLRRFMAMRAPLGDGRIMVLEQTRLAGTQSLCLVQAGAHVLLLGTNGAGLLVKLAEWPVEQAPPSVAEAMFRQSVSQAARAGDQGRDA